MSDSAKVTLENARQKGTTVVQFDDSNKGHGNMLAYGIAILAMGTALGNMFLAGGIKNLMKIKFPSQSYKQQQQAYNQSQKQQQQHQQQQQRQQYSHNHKTKYYQQTNRSTSENDFIPEGLNKIPNYIQTHFSNLNLTVNYIVPEKDIKTAYRREVMKYHPDRVGSVDKTNNDVIKLKKEYEMKFKEISNSYKFIMKNFSDRKGKTVMEHGDS